MNFVEHTFTVGDTIEGVIRLHNSHSMTADAAKIFMTFFNQKNGGTVPSLGQKVEIPVDARIARLHQ